MPWVLVSSRSSQPLLRAAVPYLSWEAMPRSSLRCTLVVLCRNLGRPRGVRGPLLGHRQFADPVLEKAYLQPRQNSYGLACDREPSRERGSRRLVPSTSTSNRAQAKYCVGCRTRQKERKQQLRQQRDSTWPPTSVVIACASVAQARPALRLSRKRVKICLPAVLPGRPGLRQHGQEHGARRLRGSEALMSHAAPTSFARAAVIAFA